MKVMAIGNHKGGSAKTTATVQLAAAAAQRGHRVLVVDLDPQANASRRLGFRWSADDPVPTVSEAIKSAEYGIAGAAVVRSGWANSLGERVDLIPSRWDLEQRISEAGQVGAFRRLAVALGDLPQEYDLTLIDLPPSLGHLTHLGLAAADVALAVVEPEYDSVEGATRYNDFINTHATDLGNPGLVLAGVMVARVRSGLGEHSFQIEGLPDIFGPLLWTPHIPERAALKDASSAGVPIQDIHSPAGREVAAIFDELAGKLEDLQKRAAA